MPPKNIYRVKSIELKMWLDAKKTFNLILSNFKISSKGIVPYTKERL